MNRARLPRRYAPRNDELYMKFIFLFLLLFSFPALANNKTQCNLNDPASLLLRANQFIEQAEASFDLRSKSKLARNGLEKADRCLKIQKNNWSCLYAHAVLLGLELETRTLKIADDLQKMVLEFETVSQNAPHLDEGGAFNALGNVYLKAPVSLSLTGDIHQDLDKALVYALEAMQIAPENPRNLFLLGEVYYKRDEFEDAQKTFQKILSLPKSKSKPYKKQVKSYLKKVKKRLKKQKLG